MANQLDNFRAAYAVLENRVQLSLRIQLGDLHRLQTQRDEVLHFQQSAEQVFLCAKITVDIFSINFQHRNVFHPTEFSVLQTSITDMVEALEDACLQSADPPQVAPLIITHRQPQGKNGRPRVEVDETFLAFALQLRGPAGVASELGCSARTIRRRALEQGLVQPGAPVYVDQTQADGTMHRVWSSNNPSSSDISDEELDGEMANILQIFPNFGRRMISGHLLSHGIQVVRERIRASYLRVHGAPAIFGDRQIRRRVYSVPGVNSLWHHDGQHG